MARGARFRPRAYSAAFVAMAVISLHGRAHAQAIDTNAYAIDLTRGPVIGSGRAIGMGGAFTSLVDGIDSVLWNPAGFAARDRNSATFVRVDGTISYGRVIAQDFDNAGARAQPYDSFNLGLAGLALQVGGFGIGDYAEYQSYTVGPSSGPQVNVQVLENRAGLGGMFFDGQLVIGADYRLLLLALQPTAGGLAASAYTTYVGHSAEIGVAWRPASLPIRLGAAVRSAADATHAPTTVVNGLQRVGNCNPPGPTCFVLPDHVIAPWEIDVGFALQLGPRPFNVRFEDPHSDDATLRRDEQHDSQTGTLSIPETSSSPPPSSSPLQQPTPSVPPGYVAPPPLAPQYAAPATGPGSQYVAPPPASAEYASLPTEPRARARAIRERYRVERWRARQQARLDRRQRYARRSRWYFMISVDVHIVAPVESGQGIDAFLMQTQHAAGRGWTVGPRVGIESELIPNFLKLRAGVYLEPSRYADVSERWHGTGGFDLKLFTTNFWGITEPTAFQFSGFIDGADRYINGGIGVGVWQ